MGTSSPTTAFAGYSPQSSVGVISWMGNRPVIISAIVPLIGSARQSRRVMSTYPADLLQHRPVNLDRTFGNAGPGEVFHGSLPAGAAHRRGGGGVGQQCVER